MFVSCARTELRTSFEDIETTEEPIIIWEADKSTKKSPKWLIERIFMELGRTIGLYLKPIGVLTEEVIF